MIIIILNITVTLLYKYVVLLLLLLLKLLLLLLRHSNSIVSDSFLEIVIYLLTYNIILRRQLNAKCIR